MNPKNKNLSLISQTMDNSPKVDPDTLPNPVTPKDGRRPAEGGSGFGGTENPDPEVSATPKRRTFTAAHKLRILEEADRCKHGELGALLRREGIYHATIQQWKNQRQNGTLSGTISKKRGPKEKFVEPSQVRKIVAENARLRKRLEQAELIIELQKKISLILDKVDQEEN